MAHQRKIIFPCGDGFLPGTQGEGGGGSETSVNSILVAKPTGSTSAPFPPVFDPVKPTNPTGPGTGGPAGPPGGGEGGGTVAGPATGGRPAQGGPTTGPTGPTAGGPLPPVPVTTGGTTGGFYKCSPTGRAQVCEGQQNLPLSQAQVISFERGCISCSPNRRNPDGTVEPDPDCVFSSVADCIAVCQPLQTGNFCEPGVGTAISPPQTTTTTPRPSREIKQAAEQFSETPPQNSVTVSLNLNTQATQIVENQKATNAIVVNATQLIQDEDFRDIQAGIKKPSLYDPNLNFFKTTPNSNIELVPNNQYLNILNSQISVEIAEILSNSNTQAPWNEITLQNLSDDKISVSLVPRVLNSFQYLRYPGGEPIGLSTMLNVVRRHILEGTLNEFDPSYYTDAAQGQIDETFEVLEKPEGEEETNRFVINYLTNTSNMYRNTKPSRWRNFQINRVRPLNEDINMEIAATTLEGTRKTLAVPNEGINLERLTAVEQTVVPSIGAPNKLNIGNGGGYYINSKNLQAVEAPIPTSNLLENSYYVPPSTRVKVLDMLGVDPSITIIASSNENQHEFVSTYPAVEELKPLFFALNLSSPTGDYDSNPLIETYSANYSLLTDASNIQTHLNNNALNTTMLAVDHRDKLYQYIYETSTLTLTMSDFNLNGFKDKGFSSIGSRFVRNIPFGVVVTPVAGGKFNPFNGRSKLIKYGNVHVRSLSFLPPTDSSIDGNQPPMFKAYSLNLRDGVNRVGVGEEESTQNIGYLYDEALFKETFYQSETNSYVSSAESLSAQGTAYMLREVIDYLSATYSATTLTWYDIYSRMPMTRLAEMFYDSSPELMLEIGNGFRGGIRIENIETGVNNSNRIIPEDSKTIVKTSDRYNVTTFKL